VTQRRLVRPAEFGQQSQRGAGQVDREADVIIVGAGPAGLASALHLLRARPQLAGRILAIEKARHPRPKVCAGGLIPKTLEALSEVDVSLQVPAVEVFSGLARTEAGTIELPPRDEPLCTIVRRDEFDASLARAARARGLELVEDARVTAVEENAAFARVITDRGVFRCSIVVGADGSGSRVRACLFGAGKGNIGRALMADIPVDESSEPEFTRRLYQFDFNCVSNGVHGYSWSFPCIINDRPHLNIGIYDQCPRERVRDGRITKQMLEALAAAFPKFEANRVYTPAYRAFPIRWYQPCGRYASLRTVLVGDAAGAEPLMGEGISSAIEHGRIAARYVCRFLDGDSSGLDHFNRAMHEERVGRKLRRLGFAARRFYGPHHRLYFRIAALSRTAQQLGVDWYNGAHRMDEVSAPRMMMKWARAVLSRKNIR
jgi:flavin-dependent dehydrogenase